MEQYAKLTDYPIRKYQMKNDYSNITLSQQEEKIFKFLLENNPFKCTFRVAGGWVRDKLINVNSEDIDITIDNITGKEYVDFLKKKFKDDLSIIRNSNAKSKHLETATIILFERQIDLVNLRKEVYTQSSRVPEISLGTPEEDVNRRDITINSLYYNINDKKIEDFTGKGIEDLCNGIIRMNKDPYISFNEDPLRMLRVMRFATRFQFKLQDNIEDNIKKDKIIKHFKEILSCERIEKELQLMMNEKYVHCTIFRLYKFNLIESIIPFEQYYNKEDFKERKGIVFLNTVNIMICYYYLSQIKKILHIDNEVMRNKINYALLMSQFRQFKLKVKKEELNGSQYILSHIYKIPNNDMNEIIQYINGIDTIKFVVTKSKEYQRLEVGLALRTIDAKFIFSIIKMCIAEEYINNEMNVIEDINEEKLSSIYEKYKAFEDFIIKEELTNINLMKPLLDGKEMKTKLRIKAGKEIGRLIDLLIQEQIKNPKLTVESAIEFLSKNQLK